MPTITKQIAKPTRKKTGSVIDRIAPVGFDQQDGIKILLYGKSGTGKTTLWSTFPGPILCLVRSGGKRPGECRSINTPEMRRKVKVVNLLESSEVKTLVEYVNEKEENPFKTIVLDHVSGLQDLVLKEILGIDELPEQKSWGLASQSQYGQCTMQSKELLRALLDLPQNVVIVGQERESEAKEDSELITPHVGVALTPALAGWLNPACDYICQTYLRNKSEIVKTKIGDKVVTTVKRGKGVEYVLRTGPHDIYTTKFRIPRGRELPSEIVDPTFEKIYELIKGT